ncbi:MAG: ribulose-phosphate 3-epimerase [Candidatus Eisenbacteria bacterium]|uniref:Ribulose-phosphate 3-epimerase n=1 Tax=Eiseniibacteriota bacterium TaxID=2212470 RepID=A0A538T8M2_UNCEI|nr:MAG: ribulose-phosphate 3-epimerase [Candidatus Eisenbacteria bacterium]
MCPSILSADFSRLGEEVERVARAGADFLHVDVMDGQFVPNLTFGPILVQAMRRLTPLPLDVHLMVVDPLRFLDDFAAAGADHLILHVETVEDPALAARLIRARGLRVGLAIKPETPLPWLLRALSGCDIALVMTVEPGQGGQPFLDGSEERIAAVRAAIEDGSLDCLLGVDGGINPSTARRAARAGADTFIAGHSIFRTPDPVAALQALRRSVETA